MVALFLTLDYKMTSHVVKEMELGAMEPKMYLKKLQRLAECICLSQRQQRHYLESSLVDNLGTGALLAYTEFQCYDETPMVTTVRVKQQNMQAMDDISVETAALLRTLQTNMKTETVLTKVFQLQADFGMLLVLDSKYIFLSGTTIAPLQALQRTTAEVMLEAIQRQSFISRAVEQFKTKTRSVCCDAYAANFKAERCLAELRSNQWQSTLLTCGVHVTSRCLKRCLESLLPSHVKGLLHTSLALRNGVALTQFRECLRQQLRSKLQLSAGPIDDAAWEYKIQALKLFTAGGKTERLDQQVLLLLAFNGDWRDTNHVTFIVGHAVNTPYLETSILAIMETILISVACSAKPPLWPRHRWIGAEVCVNWFGLLESIHGLLRPTFRAWLRVQT
eukprot:6492050-Amphidinium_carterae.2